MTWIGESKLKLAGLNRANALSQAVSGSGVDPEMAAAAYQ
jgi:hypothetical protein